jgi:hypothetical protein
MVVKKVIKAIVADVPSDANADWLHRPKAKGTISNLQHEQPHRLEGKSAKQRKKRSSRRPIPELKDNTNSH